MSVYFENLDYIIKTIKDNLVFIYNPSHTDQTNECLHILIKIIKNNIVFILKNSKFRTSQGLLILS